MRMRNITLLLCAGFLSLLTLMACTACDQKAAAPVPSSFDWRTAVTTLNYNDDDRDPDRRVAAIMLGVHRQYEAETALIEHLQRDPDPKVRAACAFALGRLGSETAIDALIKSILNSSPMVRGEIIRALEGRLNQQRVERLLILAENTDKDTLMLLVRVLAMAGFTKEAANLKTDPAHQASDNEARRIYVDAVGGDDEAPGTNKLPVATIKQGLKLLQPGDTLLVAGKKNEPLREAVIVPARLAGFSYQPTRLLAWPGKERPLIQPTHQYAASAFVAAGPGRYRLALTEKAFGVFIVRDKQVLHLSIPELADEYSDGAFYYDDEKKELVVEPKDGILGGVVEVAFAPDGILIKGAHDVLVRGFDVRYAFGSGLGVEHAYRVSFIDCSTVHCLRHGIFIYYAPLATIDSCRAENCVYQGISVRTSPQTIISHCFAFDNRTHGILLLYDSDDVVVLASESRRNFRQLSFIEGSDFGRVIRCRFDESAAQSIHYETGSIPGLIVE